MLKGLYTKSGGRLGVGSDELPAVLRYRNN